MFRFFTMLFLAIYVADLVVTAFQARRIWITGSILLQRNTNPIGYWLMTLLWSLASTGSIAGLLFLSYLAITKAGPYKEHAFLSFHQAWPYAVTTVLFGWLATGIIKDRLFQLKHRRPAA